MTENNTWSSVFFAFFPAEHTLTVDIPQTIEKVSPKHSKDLLKYMIYLDYQQLAASKENDDSQAKSIDEWFENFNLCLRQIYECPQLNLTRDAKNMNFLIELPQRPAFGFNQMADGYSSILNIVAEIMMRLEDYSKGDYSVPGIVLIDEIEAHLHISLQKTILPFLTTLFPNIQFIVTTHSPFVMASLKDKAVIYDLETQHPYTLAEQKSLSDIVREDLGVSSTMPLWAEKKLEEIMAKFAPLKSDELFIAQFKQELQEAGLSDIFLDSLPRLLEGR
jgi:hypothetical protein